MKEKTLKKFTTLKGSKAEIYQIRILVNGENCRFLAYAINGEDRKGCFLVNDLELLVDYIKCSY